MSPEKLRSSALRAPHHVGNDSHLLAPLVHLPLVCRVQGQRNCDLARLSGQGGRMRKHKLRESESSIQSSTIPYPHYPFPLARCGYSRNPGVRRLNLLNSTIWQKSLRPKAGRNGDIHLPYHFITSSAAPVILYVLPCSLCLINTVKRRAGIVIELGELQSAGLFRVGRLARRHPCRTVLR